MCEIYELTKRKVFTAKVLNSLDNTRTEKTSNSCRSRR